MALGTHNRRRSRASLKRQLKAPAESPHSHNRARWNSPRALLLSAAGIAVLTLLTFAPVRHFDFVHYDDFEFVVQNRHVATGLTVENVRWAFENPYSATGGPITWISHMVDVEIFGLAAGGHHVTSVVIHALTAVLLLVVLHAATGSVYRSATVAALFAVHPLHVESVAWIAERKDVLSGLFWFATIGAYVAYVRRPGAWRYGAVVGLFVLGLLSKPMVVTLPFVLLLMDIWPLGRLPPERASARPVGRLVVEKLPLLALGAISIGLTFVAQRQIGAVSTLNAVALSDRLANAAIAYVAYLGKTAWPEGLIPYYPFPTSINWLAAGVAAAVLVAVTAAALASLRRAPYFAVGWLWYLGTLVPVIGLVQVGGHAMADRFTYLPLTGVFIVFAWGGMALLRRLGGGADRVTAAGAVILVVALAVVARAQTSHWRDGVALWQHTVRVDPSNARAYSNLGAALAERNRMAEAIRAYEESIRLEPPFPQTLHNLGLALESAGRREAAARRYAEALRLEPDYLQPRMQLAGLLVEAGRIDEAMEHYGDAVRRHPDEPLARVNLAVGLGLSGRPSEALPHMLAAIRLEPHSAQWRYFAAMMMAEAGRTKEAIAMLKTALEIDADHADAREALRSLTGSGS